MHRHALQPTLALQHALCISAWHHGVATLNCCCNTEESIRVTCTATCTCAATCVVHVCMTPRGFDTRALLQHSGINVNDLHRHIWLTRECCCNTVESVWVTCTATCTATCTCTATYFVHVCITPRGFDTRALLQQSGINVNDLHRPTG